MITSGLFSGCTQNGPDETSSFLKSPSDFGLDPYPDSVLPVKYILSWQNPIQIEDLEGFKIFLDTANWENVTNNHNAALGGIVYKPSAGGERDSILFSFKSGGPPVDTLGLYNGIPYYQFDSAGHLDSLNFEFDFALLSIYSNGSAGGPLFTPLIVDDRFKPFPVKPIVDVTDRELTLLWTRPRDPTSFFDLQADTGVIKGYHLIIREVPDPTDSSGLSLSLDSLVLRVRNQTTLITPGSPLPPGVEYDVDDTSASVIIKVFFPDGNPFDFNPDSNVISVVLYGFLSEKRYDVQLYAEDNNFNLGKNDAEIIRVVTTDTTQPTTPQAGVDTGSLTKNRIQFFWTSSRDTRPGDSQPNQNIREYRVARMILLDTAGPVYGNRLETVLNVNNLLSGPNKQNQALFSASGGQFDGSYFFLPPGSTYRIQIWAVDSTGHRSDTAVIMVSTSQVDTSINCPPGFVPIPVKTGVNAAPFCIEPLEHQSDSVVFDVNIDLQSARAICQSGGPNIDLCTESQWNRACAGSSILFPHKYGIQAITDDTSLSGIALPNTILQSKCNQAAGDTEMAADQSLRNEECLTDEGVFDLAGNYSEWVVSNSTPNLLLFKGGNYLIPALDISQIRTLAQCDYRGLPRQKRPNFLLRCLSTERHLALVYKKTDGKDSVICPDMTGNVDRVEVPGRDSSSLIVHFLETNIPQMQIALIDSTDSLTMKAPRVVLYDSLPIVYFLPDTLVVDSASLTDWGYADTLGYSDFINSGIPLFLDSLPTDHPVLTRETNVSQWQIIPVDRIFGYVLPDPLIPHSKVAKPFYSNSVIGFRCCVNGL